MCCILCLCIILCDTSKASQNKTFFFLNKVSFCRVFCCHHYLLSQCHEDQRLCRTNYITFITFDVPEEKSVTFEQEVDLNDDAVGRSRYERFYSVRSNLICDFEDIRESPVEWDTFEGTFACEVEATNSRTHFKEYPKVL